MMQLESSKSRARVPLSTTVDYMLIIRNNKNTPFSILFIDVETQTRTIKDM